ncbi:T9SS type A sorting domain-containing protein [Membranihabitans maritimus]|uniref:T9SS type A sorting domain-containing protein n=1 Tax=Membranihabitans maritimus TaxID=2904244 RepID=UPI001F44336A|nr:T9SS type A sorting domain-containing protein [Membranihabitans maritimus]
MNNLRLILGFLLLNITVYSQSPFTIALEPFNISELGGLQSFAFGQDQEKWLLVGGRLDGLHQRQPWATFDIAGHNNQLIVVDPISHEKWGAPLSSLPISIQEHLSSTNMNFYQEGAYLYIIGGYGYSTTQGNHITYPYLTAIKVPDVINAIVNGLNFSMYFRQIEDPRFQVTGGQLQKIYDIYYLLGGQIFLGRYNPMNNPTFYQEYTNQIRRFSLQDDGVNIVVQHLSSYTDAENLHRRDYNAAPQILPNGEEGITMFSGVFQPTVNLPFLNSVTVDSSNYSVNNSFLQYYNHYHCATIPLYSSSENEMHTVFFGGIAQYYDSAGILVQDNNVPFVKTIARVTREANGKMTEYKLPIEMPVLLGAGSEFIPNVNQSLYNNGVYKLDEITRDSTLIGYIFGGIISSEANIFWNNDGTQSTANSQIYKVYLTNTIYSGYEGNPQETGSLNLSVNPNPNDGHFVVDYFLKKDSDVKLTMYDMQGATIRNVFLENQSSGNNTYTLNASNQLKSGVYAISIQTTYGKATQKFIFK